MTNHNIIIVATESALRNIAAKISSQQQAKTIKKYLPGSGLSLLTSIAGQDANYLLLKNKSVLELKNKIIETLDIGYPVVFISPSEAIKKYNFKTGHIPQNGSVYIKHPVLENTYICPGEYDLTLQKEKEAAFKQVMCSLGAKSVHITNIETSETKGILGLRVPLEKITSTLGVDVSISSTGTVEKSLYCEFGKPRKKISIPNEFKAWVDFDPELRTITKNRLEGSLLKTQSALSFKRQTELTAGLSALVEKVQVSGNVSVSKSYNSLWYFEIEYYEV